MTVFVRSKFWVTHFYRIWKSLIDFDFYHCENYFMIFLQVIKHELNFRKSFNYRGYNAQ